MVAVTRAARSSTHDRVMQRRADRWPVPMTDPTPRVGGVPRRPAATAAPSAPSLQVQCQHRPPVSASGSGKEGRRHAVVVAFRTNDRVMQGGWQVVALRRAATVAAVVAAAVVSAATSVPSLCRTLRSSCLRVCSGYEKVDAQSISSAARCRRRWWAYARPGCI